ncbi:hypothetical protein, partial [Limosilactobacillus fermentum]|uniref:hypothetical protein n=1 Tax=Limosilactobacillus fermentum TaxID=1613 RepID=UPI003EB72004
CPQNQKILSTNHHYGNPSTRFSVEPIKSISWKIDREDQLWGRKSNTISFIRVENNGRHWQSLL